MKQRLIRLWLTLRSRRAYVLIGTVAVLLLSVTLYAAARGGVPLLAGVAIGAFWGMVALFVVRGVRT